MRSEYDLIVIGAGPAGQAAAVSGYQNSLSVLVLDEQAGPGGQIYRSIESAHPDDSQFLGPDYLYGKSLAKAFRQSEADYITHAAVWEISRDSTLCYSHNGASKQVAGKRILIASGAMERPCAIPGWTLPGVMGAGAADVLFKTAGIVPSGRVVFCGGGPLLLLVASHFVNMGVNVAAVLETVRPGQYLQALKHLPEALKASDYLIKGLKMRMALIRSRVPTFQNVRQVRIQGDEQVRQISFNSLGRNRQVSADTLWLHDGVIPHTQLTRQLECDHLWNPIQRYWHPQTDKWGESSVTGIFAAGDTACVQGAIIAEIQGRLAALEIACQLGKLSRKDRDKTAAPLRRKLKREMSVRPFLEHLFQPNHDFLAPSHGQTLVCRCEEITADQIRHAVSSGCRNTNQVKAQTRCGMGPCQGRMCSLTTAEIIAHERQADTGTVGAYRVRPPVKPIPLNELADLEMLT
ncbi:NAD(P)/FAD-dependent oxidoreductase [Desulfococcaceae bacterium HSG7]|nr:NAD(P)/FAD-dependent oxidoreductase [Desulfococcaceae bacterium HSG7]